jgi:uncharacterized protein YcfL
MKCKHCFCKVPQYFLLFLLGAMFSLTGCTPTPSAKVTSLGSLGYVAAGSFSETGDFVPREQDRTLISKDYTIRSVKGVCLDGVKKAQLKVENNTGHSLQLEYRFVWYDVAGMDISADSDAWQPFTVEGRAAKTISSASKSILAKSFEIYVRPLEYVKR